MERAFRLGANLVLWKPVTVDEAERVLRAAYELLNRVRRQFARLVPKTLAFASIEGMAEDVMILDLSKGGMGVQAMAPLTRGTVVETRVYLPGVQSEIVAKGEVAWSDDSGRAGIRFEFLSGSSRTTLESWLTSQTSEGATTFPLGTPDSFAPPTALEAPGGSQRTLAGCLDALLVSLGALLFSTISRLVTSSQLAATTGILQSVLTFLLFWLAYRSVFFRNVSETPGALLGRRICDWHLRLLERRRLDHFPSITTLE